ncbi:MAG: 50S ribosomal protein L25 [Planctomycetaceae bacterium]|nr:50S ribosomal protein L25 [Planctomycetaceae bacterium]
MSDATTLSAAKRERLGTAECRRLRREGMVPGNLYGHGEGAVSFKIGHDDVLKMVEDGHIAIDLDIDGKVDKALFKEVQWDTFGKHIVHVDLIRVDPNEKVEVEVPVEIKGEAPGVEEGGILDTQMHTLLVKCPVFKIPSAVVVRVGSLKMFDAIRVEDLNLDPDVEPQAPGDEVVVQVVEPRKIEEPDEEAADLEGVEPELVGESEEEQAAGEEVVANEEGGE